MFAQIFTPQKQHYVGPAATPEEIAHDVFLSNKGVPLSQGSLYTSVTDSESAKLFRLDGDQWTPVTRYSGPSCTPAEIAEQLKHHTPTVGSVYECDGLPVLFTFTSTGWQLGNFATKGLPKLPETLEKEQDDVQSVHSIRDLLEKEQDDVQSIHGDISFKEAMAQTWDVLMDGAEKLLQRKLKPEIRQLLTNSIATMNFETVLVQLKDGIANFDLATLELVMSMVTPYLDQIFEPKKTPEQRIAELEEMVANLSKQFQNKNESG